FELDALELKDMPATFVLYLEQGVSVYIRPKPQGFISHLGSIGPFLSWNLWAPLKNLWFELRKKPFSAINLKLAGKENVKAIYWALPDRIKGLLFPL
ncbi:MAG: hypothetical protein AB1715_03840, partial [Acidobacteriota bacterium]